MKQKYWFLLIILPLIIYLLYWSNGIIPPFVVAFFLAYAINPLVDWIERKGAKRSYAILTVYLFVFVVAALIIEMIVPRLAGDLSRVLREIPSLLKMVEHQATLVEKFNQKRILPFDISLITSELIRHAEIWIRRLLLQLADGLLGFFSQSVLLALIPLLSYYISRDYPQMKKKTFRWLLKNFGSHWTKTFLKIDSVFRLYIRGQLFVTAIVGVLISIGLSIMGFEGAVFLGLLAGIFNLIPYFGPVLGALPAILIGVLNSPWYILYVAVLFLAVNQIEVLVLTPRIIGESLGMHPITVVYLVLAGGKIFGVLGMIFAVPLGALVIILMHSIYEICFGITKNGTENQKLVLSKEKLD